MEGHENQRMLKILLITMPISVTTVLIMNLAGSKYLHLNPGKKFGIVLDAASTYTSIYLYHWPMNTMNGTGVVSQLYKCDVDGDFQLCQRPSKGWPVTQAMLRQNAKVNPTKGIPGNQHLSGRYRWHAFTRYSWEGIWIHPEPIQTFGLLDLGSSSTQLTFIPKQVFKNMPGKMNIHLYGYNYTIYTQSYPCYGQQQSIRKYIATLLKGKDLNTRIENPCYLKGYETMLTLDSIFGNPCTSTQRPSPYNGTQNFTVFGSGEPAKCSQGLKAIFNFTACGRSTTCSFDRVYQPAIHGNFYATSGFFHVFQFLNLTSVRPSLYKTKRTIEEFCTRNWKEVDAAYPNEKHEQLRDYCISANYIYILLVNGYEFNSSTWENIVFDKKIGQTDIGWTLGYMLNHTNMISSKPPGKIKTQSNTVWSSVSSILGLTTLLSVLVNVIHFKQKAESKIQPLAGKFHCAN